MLFDGEGVYLSEKKCVFMIVVFCEELVSMKLIIFEIDLNVFVNIIEIVEVLGFFRRS